MSVPQTSFKTESVLVPVSPNEDTVYTAPPGYYSIVLTCQVVNTGETEETFTLMFVRGLSQNPMVYEYSIPPKEVLNILGGSLGTMALEPNDSYLISGSSSDLNFTISVVETLILK